MGFNFFCTTLDMLQVLFFAYFIAAYDFGEP